jgi:uroporphyrinogen-III synthase
MRSLNNKTVVLTRDSIGNAVWAKRLESLSAQVYSLPTIETAPLEPTAQNKAIIEHLSDFDWLVFTSGTSVRYFRGLLYVLGRRWPLARPKTATIGPQTAHLIEQNGFQVDFQPTRTSGTTLGEELTPVQGKHILLPRTDIASDDLATLLSKRGGDVTTLPLYTTHMIGAPDKEFLRKLKADAIDFIVFASPSGVRGFALQVADPNLLQKARLLPAIAIGPSTATALHEVDFRHVFTSRTPSLDGIIAVLHQLIRK